jgi:hypothetical protein
MRQSCRYGSSAVALLLLFSLGACGALIRRSEPKLSRVRLVAVLPIALARSPQQAAPVAVESPPLAPQAGRVVTAQIYGVMAESTAWRFVPDLTVDQVAGSLPETESLEARALLLGKAVGADAVIYGTVARFREREGSEAGARWGASVSFQLALLTVATAETVWHGEFDQTQQSLSANLFDWWMFWRGGPRWFSARELARLGVERLLEELAARMG